MLCMQAYTSTKHATFMVGWACSQSQPPLINPPLPISQSKLQWTWFLVPMDRYWSSLSIDTLMSKIGQGVTKLGTKKLLCCPPKPRLLKISRVGWLTKTHRFFTHTVSAIWKSTMRDQQQFTLKENINARASEIQKCKDLPILSKLNCSCRNPVELEVRLV